MLFGSTPMEELSKIGPREKLGCDTVTTKSWLVPWVNSGAETDKKGSSPGPPQPRELGAGAEGSHTGKWPSHILLTT